MDYLPGVEELLGAPPSEVPACVAEKTSEVLGCSAALLFADGLDYVRFYLTGAFPDTVGQIPRELRETDDLVRVVRDRTCLAGPRGDWNGLSPLEQDYLAAVPLLLRDTAIGVLMVGRSEPFDDGELAALERLGVRAGAAVSVAEKYTDVIDVARRRKNPSVAAELQSSQLPPRSLYTPQVEVVGGIEPAYDVGGDWFDYALNDGELFVAVCDGVGRGLEAARVSYVTLGAVRNARKRREDLPRIMEIAHRALMGSTNSEQFATLIMARIQLETYEMELVSAAHPPPILVPPGKTRSPGLLQLPGSSYPPIGAFEEERDYITGHYSVEPGSRLVFFSDGALEARNAAREQLGLDSLLHAVDDFRNLGKMDFLRDMMQYVDRYAEEIEDDVTLVSVDLPGHV